MQPLIAEIGKRFQSLHPEVQIEVQSGGSGRGIDDVRKGRSAIGMVSRTLTAKERDLYGFPVARDGVSIILHRDNPVKSLSDTQVVGIFTGRIVNWKRVGGHNATISPLEREKGRGSSELFNTYYHLRESEIVGRVIAGDISETINAVASNPRAIGYASSGEAVRKVGTGVPIKLLPLNNVTPTRRNIISGNYPIIRSLVLVTKGLPTGQLKAFIDYCLSAATVDLIERHDFVPYED
jgi:phosphate transport system substrate-binding protein